MSEKIVCRLRLTVIGTLVDGKLQWREEIWTEGMRRDMAHGACLRDYEPEMCRVGCTALEAYEEQCEADYRARLNQQKPPSSKEGQHVR